MLGRSHHFLGITSTFGSKCALLKATTGLTRPDSDSDYDKNVMCHEKTCVHLLDSIIAKLYNDFEISNFSSSQATINQRTPDYRLEFFF